VLANRNSKQLLTCSILWTEDRLGNAAEKNLAAEPLHIFKRSKDARQELVLARLLAPANRGTQTQTTRYRGQRPHCHDLQN